MFVLCVHVTLVFQLLREQGQRTGWRWGQRQGWQRQGRWRGWRQRGWGWEVTLTLWWGECEVWRLVLGITFIRVVRETQHREVWKCFMVVQWHFDSITVCYCILGDITAYYCDSRQFLGRPKWWWSLAKWLPVTASPFSNTPYYA